MSEQGHGANCHPMQACVQLVPIFNHLESEQIKEVMNVVHSTSYQVGEHLFHAGDRSDALYVVHTGKVRVYRLSETGREQLVRLLLPGDFTGELALFREGEHESYAEVIESAQICRISRLDLQPLLERYPMISIHILNELATRLEKAEQQTTRFATEKVQVRLAHFLAELMPSIESKAEVNLPMSRKDLATYLGTTPETISRTLSSFEKEGYLTQKGHKKIIIHDIDKLLIDV
ncbi:Crp/Fnr family transcriptional regulator [Amphibacillus sp. MSJ-3]|uniref:Crp/Fnr family transcriptional regulator n=1 Tax=Amphibacillus sp. MSJ-3 TaxID=2841505 RepID=UPI001C0EC141|nr:Crp/Fnr family transcriptional regulator [Amphibacillus sp. MSJ-3]MBU5593766.1 Crp/Fnr family transcriptional regulator [Amphibacillus sp. MSJ-3]